MLVQCSMKLGAGGWRTVLDHMRHHAAMLNSVLLITTPDAPALATDLASARRAAWPRAPASFAFAARTLRA